MRVSGVVHSPGRKGKRGVDVRVVLGDYVDVEVFLEVDKGAVAGVGLDGVELRAALVVELMDYGGVACEAVGAAHLHHRVLLPEASGVAEGGSALNPAPVLITRCFFILRP